MARDITDLPPCALTAIIRITPTIAHPTATTARTGSLMAFSSARVRGMDGAGVTAGADAIGTVAAGADEVGKAEVLEADLTAIEVFEADSAAEGLKVAADLDRAAEFPTVAVDSTAMAVFAEVTDSAAA